MEVCYVCNREYLASAMREGWAAEHDTHGLSVCIWCVNRGWPLMRRMRETFMDIGSRSCECAQVARDALGKPGTKMQSATGLLGDEDYERAQRKTVRRVRKRR